jgi:hypothetical protein
LATEFTDLGIIFLFFVAGARWGLIGHAPGLLNFLTVLRQNLKYKIES